MKKQPIELPEPTADIPVTTKTEIESEIKPESKKPYKRVSMKKDLISDLINPNTPSSRVDID